MPFHVFGLDLGQSRDYSALSLLEVEPTKHKRLVRVMDPEFRLPDEREEMVEGLPLHLRLRYLRQFPLETSYPSVVEDTGRLMRKFRSLPMLAVDATGVGRGVVDLLTLAGLEPTPVEITAGSVAHISAGRFLVPKKDLVATLLVAMQEDRLRMGGNLPQLPLLLNQLANFRQKITKSANTLYEADKESDHDDLVVSIALAAWLAEQVVTSSLTEAQVVPMDGVTISRL